MRPQESSCFCLPSTGMIDAVPSSGFCYLVYLGFCLFICLFFRFWGLTWSPVFIQQALCVLRSVSFLEKKKSERERVGGDHTCVSTQICQSKVENLLLASMAEFSFGEVQSRRTRLSLAGRANGKTDASSLYRNGLKRKTHFVFGV